MAVLLPKDDELSVRRLDVGNHHLQLWHIRDLDSFLTRLLAEHPNISDDDIPYYAWIWPTAKVMAERILAAGSLVGVTALEMGCGTGLVGLAAALAGAKVTLTDLQDGALQLSQRNAVQAGLTDRVQVQAMDWREPGHPRVTLLLASDVLYEARFVEPVCHAVVSLLAADGVALLGDPSRSHAPKLLEALAAHGLVHRLVHQETGEEGAVVRLYAVGAGEALARVGGWLAGAHSFLPEAGPPLV